MPARKKSPQTKKKEKEKEPLQSPVVSPGSSTSSPTPSSKSSQKSSEIEDEEAVTPLEIPWYHEQTVVAIDTIGDGSCFIHSLLTAVDPKYQENDSLSFRTRLARDIRKSLAIQLALPAKDENGEDIEVTEEILQQRKKLKYLKGVTDPLTHSKLKNNYPYIINYEDAIGGAFVLFYEQEKEGGEEFTGPDDEPIDYSLEGLQDLFDSKHWLGDETFAYIGNMFKVTIYIVKQTIKKKKNTLIYISDTKMIEKDKRPAIVIMGDGTHFGVLAVATDKGYQTIFKYNHPFIKALNESKRRK